MEYDIQRLENVKKFKPFSVTLTFETKKEYVDFHDNVLKHITNGPHQFIGDFYKMGQGSIDGASGKI